MKWVKASERFPEQVNPESLSNVTFRRISDKSPVTDIWKFHDTNIELGNGSSICGETIYYDDVEWLDESGSDLQEELDKMERIADSILTSAPAFPTEDGQDGFVEGFKFGYSFALKNDLLPATVYSKRDVDFAYLIAVINTSGIDGLLKEIQRLKGLGKNPSDVLDMVKKLNQIN